MSRQKSYYSADEITNNLYASKNQLMYTDGTEYIGLYHQYSTGEIYSQSTWNPIISKKLINYEVTTTSSYKYKELNNINVKFVYPIAKTPLITTSAIRQGNIVRYFVQKINTKVITEIDRQQFDDWKSAILDNIIYKAAKIIWYITGEKSDSINGNIKNQGVKTKNIKQINTINKKLPGISDILTDPLQYYTDTDFIKPTDINGLDS